MLKAAPVTDPSGHSWLKNASKARAGCAGSALAPCAQNSSPLQAQGSAVPPHLSISHLHTWQGMCLSLPLAYLTSSLHQLFLNNLFELLYLTLPSTGGCSFPESSYLCQKSQSNPGSGRKGSPRALGGTQQIKQVQGGRAGTNLLDRSGG